MLDFIKHLFIPRPPIVETVQMVAARELHEAQMELMQAQKELEYWQSRVPMLRSRIIRLETTLNVDNSL